MIIDANIFLEGIFQQSRAEKCRFFLKQVAKGEKQAIVSSVSVDSIVFVMLRHKLKEESVRDFLSYLLKFEGIVFYQIKIKDRIESLKFMQKYGLDYEDALILQTAIVTNSEEIVSYDKHFDKIKEIKRVEP